MAKFYSTCRYLQGITLKLFSDYQVVGQENIPPMGPLIVVSNHLSYIDPSVLSHAVKRRLNFLAKRSLFIGFPVSQMLYAYGAHPLNRQGSDIAAVRWAKDKLSRDGTLVIFPEGTRSNGELLRGKQGAARIIQMTGSTILPVGITGTQHLQSLLRAVNPTGNIKVTIGPPFSLPTIEGKISPDVMQSMTDMIMGRIASLLPNEYRGVYRDNSIDGEPLIEQKICAE
jgi:1-acyl-sn-glycerol-3-phosphate acyltransferase